MQKSQIDREFHSESINETNIVRWINHQEKQILYVDYTNILTTDKLLDTIKEATGFIKKIGQYEILLLVDVRNSRVNEKIGIDALKNSAITIKPYVTKAAVVGATKEQEIIITVVNMFSNLGLKPFETIDNAKDWLVD